MKNQPASYIEIRGANTGNVLGRISTPTSKIIKEGDITHIVPLSPEEIKPACEALALQLAAGVYRQLGDQHRDLTMGIGQRFNARITTPEAMAVHPLFLPAVPESVVRPPEITHYS